MRPTAWRAGIDHPGMQTDLAIGQHTRITNIACVWLSPTVVQFRSLLSPEWENCGGVIGQ